MRDLYLEWGSDLAVDSGGDLALAVGSDAARQRVSRRLLTNTGDYLWNLDYGGGLAQFVGTPANQSDIEAVVRLQLSLENSVAATPTPQVKVSIVDRANGYVAANIVYSDAYSESQVNLNLIAN